MTENNKPTETQIQVLLSDWLGNLRQGESGNFSHKGSGGIRRSSSGEDMADYLLGDPECLDNIELMKRTRMAAEHVVNAVVSEPVTVTVGGNMSCHTSVDGKQVVSLATDYFDDSELNNRQKANIMLGLAAHEAAHGAFTESSEIEKKIMAEPEETRFLKKQIWNVLEDERIEYLLGDSRPGLADCIGKTKGYFFKRLVQRMKQNGGLPTEPLPKFLNTLMQAVRYPSELTREEVEENFDNLNKIRSTLSPFPLTSDGVWEATDRIIEIIREMAKEQARQKESQQKESENNNKKQSENENQKESKKDDGKSKKSKEPSKEEIKQALKDMLSSQQTKDMLMAMAQDADKSNGNNASEEIIGYDAGDNMQYVNESDSESVAGAPGEPKTYVFKPKGQAKDYLASLTSVRKYIPAMAKSLSCKGRDRDYCLHGLPSGKLNANKLASFKMGNPNIFDKAGTVKCSSASVIMLIDESGSMSGRRQQAARDAAVLVNEAIKRIPKVNFFCYGYTTEKINVYSEAGKTSPWALGATEATNGTPTGDAMRMCAQRVKRFTSDPCIMLVLTDGAADFSDRVIEQDKALRSKNIFPIGVGIQSNSVRNTFKESIVMTDISMLAIEMGKLTKGRLDKMLIKSEEQ